MNKSNINWFVFNFFMHNLFLQFNYYFFIIQEVKSRKKRTVFDLGQHINCATKKWRHNYFNSLSYNNYGCYCGTENVKSYPVDMIDLLVCLNKFKYLVWSVFTLKQVIIYSTLLIFSLFKWNKLIWFKRILKAFYLSIELVSLCWNKTSCLNLFLKVFELLELI